MQLDPDNPIVRLCVDGMECERKGEYERALTLFQQAWERSTNSFESCVAAHYVARHQPTPADMLRWNEISLDRANQVETDEVREFYPSLYLNLGKSHEDLGNNAEAARFYLLASAAIEVLPEGQYRDMVQDGVNRGLGRVGALDLPGEKMRSDS